MKSMKFTPGTYLEMDDLVGGRKVVLVGKDGVTYWDICNSKQATPIVIHPKFNPTSIGTLAQISGKIGISFVKRVVEKLKAISDDKADDGLYLVRVLWQLQTNKISESNLTDDALKVAIDSAIQQEVTAARIHEHAKKFVEMN